MCHGHDGSQSATWPRRTGSVGDLRQTPGLRSSRTNQKSDMWKPFFIFMLVV